MKNDDGDKHPAAEYVDVGADADVSGSTHTQFPVIIE